MRISEELKTVIMDSGFKNIRITANAKHSTNYFVQIRRRVLMRAADIGGNLGSPTS